MMNRLMLALCFFSSQPAHAYKHFQEKIPNGEHVPHPGQPSTLWEGVGHLNAGGGGTRNLFGVDFAENNFQWDATLCQKDSDGDGRTNGQELGDPDCEWSPGKTPMTNTDLSHPGICEPLVLEMCRRVNQHIRLSSGSPFDCPATKEPDVKAIDYRFPVTTLPAKTTTYMCKFFPVDVPEGTSEHVIAYERIIDNAEVLHHMWIYGCTEEQSKVMMSRTSPEECGGGYKCREIIAIWNVFFDDGFCYPKEFGFHIGAGKLTGLWIEIHYNNPLGNSGLTDSSGFRLYQTPKLRAWDAGFHVWGTSVIELPPGEKNVLQTGGCPSECTKYFKDETIYISHIVPHTHLLGRAMTISINGRQVLEDRNVVFGKSGIYIFDPPLEFNRGDHFGVNCTYTTTSVTERTYWGPSSVDEMCHADFIAYPHHPTVPTYCFDADGYGFCDRQYGNYAQYGNYGRKDCTRILSRTDWKKLEGILAPTCDPSGVECLEWCPDAIRKVEQLAPCLAGKGARSIRGSLSRHMDMERRRFLNALLSCQTIVYDDKMDEYEELDK